MSLWKQPRRLLSSSSDGGKNDTTQSSPSATAPPIEQSSSSGGSPLSEPELLKNLPSEQERRRSDTSKRFSRAMDDLQTAVFTAGQKLNILTGYSDIERLKKAIEAQEDYVQQSRNEVRNAKEDYQSAINRRSASQREVNELLQRKHAWSPIDLERFTELYRSDHANEQNESAAQERLALAERTADEAQAELARSILARYHEEQIWSDKIRRASTWGTWGLMGFNVLLFIIVQLGLEPWKRKRLVGGFEEKVREVIQEESLKNALLHAQHIAGEEQSAIQPGAEILETAITSSSSDVRDMPEFAAIEQPVAISESQKEHTTNINAGEGVSGSKQTILNETQKSLKFVKEKAQELMSERKIMVSQKELTIVAAQSAAVGAVLTALVSIVISSR